MIADLTHCVFRRATQLAAIPALSVREVVPRPVMIDLPRTPGIFAGICHIRSEFIPVLNLSTVYSESGLCDDGILLVVEDSDSVWGILVDEVVSLLALETSDAPEGDEATWNSVVVGWCVHEESVIDILDPGRLRELAEAELATSQSKVSCDHQQSTSEW